MTLDGFRAELNSLLRDLLNPHNEVDRPQRLYHYTDQQCLIKILNSRQIWINDIRHQRNDPGDGRYYARVIPNVLRRKSVPRQVIDYFSDGDVMKLGEKTFAYVASFSARKNLMSQWQEFADQGRGAAIEVKFDTLFRNGASTSDFALMRMIYDLKVQEDMLTRITDYAIHRLRELGLTRKAKEQFWEEIITPILVCGAFFKSPHYAKEQEWRVWKLAPDPSAAARPMSSHGTEIGYETLHLTEELTSQIVLGPQCELGVSDTLGLAHAAGFPALAVIRIDPDEMI